MNTFKHAIGIAVFAVVAVTPTVASAQNLLNNAGFETYDVSKADINGGDYFTYDAGNTGISDWSVSGVSVDTVIPPYDVYAGASALDLAGTPGPGAVSQTVGTEIGQTYTVSVFAKNTSADGLNNFFTMSLGGDQQTFQTTGTYAQYSFTSVATSTSETFTLSTLPGNNTNGNSFVDSASVQAVPEPASFGAIGLGIIGLLRRKRS